MIKYTSLDAVVNYLPDAVRKDLDLLKIKFHANQAYRRFDLPFQKEIQYAVIDVVNHKAILPSGLVRIVEMRYNPFYPDSDVLTVLKDYSDYRLIVSQEVFFGSTYYSNSRPMRYLGQNRSAMIDENMYCNTCDVGFSVNSELNCLTVDVADGSIIVGYWTNVYNDNDELVIPDHPDLLLGLAYWIQCQYWLNKAASHTENAMNLYRETSRLAEVHLNNFRSKRLFASLNVKKHNEFTFGRNRPNYDYRRNTYNKR